MWKMNKIEVIRGAIMKSTLSRSLEKNPPTEIKGKVSKKLTMLHKLALKLGQIILFGSYIFGLMLMMKFVC